MAANRSFVWSPELCKHNRPSGNNGVQDLWHAYSSAAQSGVGCCVTQESAEDHMGFTSSVSSGVRAVAGPRAQLHPF